MISLGINRHRNDRRDSTVDDYRRYSFVVVCCGHIQYLILRILAALVQYFGLGILVAVYAGIGAVIFRAIELPREQSKLGHIKNDTQAIADEMLAYTAKQEVLNEDDWKLHAEGVLRYFEQKLVLAVDQEGYDGNDDTRKVQWTFTGALLYSISVFTTIGYGHIVPKTSLGRVVTMIYATFGIPLMLLCLANIADSLTKFFTFIYFNVCCFYCRWLKRRKRRRRAALCLRTSSTYNSRKGRIYRQHQQYYWQATNSATTSNHVRRKPTSYYAPRGVRMYQNKPDADPDSLSLPSYRDRRGSAPRSGKETPVSPLTPMMRRKSSASLSSPYATRHSFRQRREPESSTSSSRYGGASLRNRQGSFRRSQSVRNKPSIKITLNAHKPASARKISSRSDMRVNNHTKGSLKGKRSVPNTATSETINKKKNSDPFREPLLSAQGRSCGAQDLRRKSSATSLASHVLRTDMSQSVASKKTEDSMETAVSLDTKRYFSYKEHTIESSSELYSYDLDQVVNFGEHAEETYESFRSKRSAREKAKHMPISVGIITLVLFLVCGALLFSIWEHWNLFDGMYFCFITTTTIGFGDIVPGRSMDDESHQERLIACSVYLLVGMALIAMCFRLMQDDIVEKTRFIGERIGILAREIEIDDFSDDLDDEELVFAAVDEAIAGLGNFAELIAPKSGEQSRENSNDGAVETVTMTLAPDASMQGTTERSTYVLGTEEETMEVDGEESMTGLDDMTFH